MPNASFPHRQTPEGGEIFLDHAGWYVADMDAASAAFERLGFRLTPFTAHSHAAPDGARHPSGTANRCAMLEIGYLEILTHVPDLDTPLASQLRAGLGRYGGLHLIAFTCADADAEHARLTAGGFAPLPVAALRRPIAMDDGSEGETRFSVIRLAPGAMAEGRIQMLTQDTPATTWQPSLIARDNAVDALTGIIVCCADPAEAVARFARFTARAAAGSPISLPLDRGRLTFATPDQCRSLIPGFAAPSDPFIAACVMRSRDLAATARFLAGCGVAAKEAPGGALCVDAGDAMGAYLLIHGPGGP